jgi:pimeloyl-ACP methyl ester carboxylesterase
MKKINYLILCLSAIVGIIMLTLPACYNDGFNPDFMGDTTQVDTTVIDTNTIDTLSPPPCSGARPVVMLHGFLASGDTYANTVMRFTSNNYCPDLLYVYDWNTLGGGNDNAALSAFIDQVLSQTGATQVDLVGHSAGSGFCYTYLSDDTRAAKVAHYVHLAGAPQNAPAGATGNVPTLNIYSDADQAVTGGDIAGAQNINLVTADHYQVATSAATFAAMYTFFNNAAPTTDNIVPQTSISISGKVLTLGENQARANSTIAIYETDPNSGERLSDTPNYLLNSDANGKWGPINVTPNATYEFHTQTGISNDRTVIYYREGFKHSNPLVYLRTLPAPGSLAGILLNALPSNDDNQSIVASFTASQATLNGRDQLSANGYDLATPQYAPASETAIAYFLYDNNQNGQSDGNIPATFALVPFLTGADLFFATEPRQTIHLLFNGRQLNVPSLKSASDGIIVAVFD